MPKPAIHSDQPKVTLEPLDTDRRTTQDQTEKRRLSARLDRHDSLDKSWAHLLPFDYPQDPESLFPEDDLAVIRSLHSFHLHRFSCLRTPSGSSDASSSLFPYLSFFFSPPFPYLHLNASQAQKDTKNQPKQGKGLYRAAQLDQTSPF